MYLVGIDYFSRVIMGKVIEDRSTDEIISTMSSWFNAIGPTEELITDNAKEFVARKFKEFCGKSGIGQRVVSVEAHQSNRREKRAKRSIRDGLCKYTIGKLDSRIKRIVKVYNETYHEGLKCTPKEAWSDSAMAIVENSKEGCYNQRFKKREI